MSDHNANPEGFHTLTPFVYMTDIARAVEFYRKSLEQLSWSAKRKRPAAGSLMPISGLATRRC